MWWWTQNKPSEQPKALSRKGTSEVKANLTSRRVEVTMTFDDSEVVANLNWSTAYAREFAAELIRAADIADKPPAAAVAP